jgi:hypothetical protein
LVFDGESVDFSSYLSKLGKYKFAICPPGNGIDSHRIWECLYLNVIPILIRSDFTERINKRFACVLLDSWNDFDADKILADYKIPTYSDDLAFKNIKLGLDAYF